MSFYKTNKEGPSLAVAMAIMLLLLLIFVGIGYFLSEMVIHIRTYGDEDIYTYETKAGTLVRENIDSLPQEEVFIHSPFGYQLRGLFFTASKEAEKAIVLVHGIMSSHVSSLKYMEMFRKRGFHVLAYDHRRHGGSGGSSTTFGLYEKHDLNACVEWLIERFGRNCKIGIFGESMGAATALQHAPIDKRVAFYIADCPYSDLKTVLKYRLKQSYLPSFPVLQIAGLFAWLRAGLRFHLDNCTWHRVQITLSLCA
jgi:pimeloyl-ACP methyl ester carboxylesterase